MRIRRGRRDASQRRERGRHRVPPAIPVHWPGRWTRRSEGPRWPGPACLPIGFALAGAKADERQVLQDILADPALTAGRDSQIIIADKNYYGHGFETVLADGRICLLRPARQGEPERPGTRFFKPLRQVIESNSDTFKGQFDLERHGGHTPAGVMVRVLQRILALTTAIWHNDHTGQPVKRSLVACDH